MMIQNLSSGRVIHIGFSPDGYLMLDWIRRRIEIVAEIMGTLNIQAACLEALPDAMITSSSVSRPAARRHP